MPNIIINTHSQVALSRKHPLPQEGIQPDIRIESPKDAKGSGLVSRRITDHDLLNAISLSDLATTIQSEAKRTLDDQANNMLKHSELERQLLGKFLNEL